MIVGIDGEAESIVDVRGVLDHGLLRHNEPGRDPCVAPALGDESEDLLLPG